MLGEALIAQGGTGDDGIYGHLGHDRLAGGPGDDRITGHRGADTVRGGAGNDLVYGSLGADRVNGGEHRDTCGGERRRNCERIDDDDSLYPVGDS